MMRRPGGRVVFDGREATEGGAKAKHPAGGTSPSPLRGGGSSAGGIPGGGRGRYPHKMFMSSASTAHRSLAARPSSGALLDVTVAAAALAGTLALLRHGGIGPSYPGSRDLDLVGAVLAGCSTLPLIAWRRFPLGVFAVTAAAGALLVGLGYRVDLLLGPTVALYLLAASRQPQTPWTWRTTAIVVGLLVAYLGAAAAAQASLPCKRTVAYRSRLGGCLVRRRANPAAARAGRRAQRTRAARRARRRA